MSQQRWIIEKDCPNDIDHPSVLVTGASSGIGLAVVELLAQKGYHVWATSRKPKESDRLSQLSEQYSAVRLDPMDVTDEASIENSVQKLLATWGTIDAVINNAGFGVFGPSESLTIDQVRYSPIPLWRRCLWWRYFLLFSLQLIHFSAALAPILPATFFEPQAN